MALPFTDSFTNSDGTALPTHNSAWTENVGSWAINSNNVYIDETTTESLAHDNSNVYTDNQYAKLTITAVDAANNSSIGPATRVHASNDTCYFYFHHETIATLERRVNGVNTQLSGTIATLVVGHVLSLHSVESRHTPRRDGSTINAPPATTDTVITSGSGGMQGRRLGSSNEHRADNFESSGVAQIEVTWSIRKLDNAAIVEAYAGSQTIEAEWSLTTDTAGPDVATTDGVYQIFLDVSSMISGEELRIRVYEKVQSGDTQRIVYEAHLFGKQATPIWTSRELVLMHGWDVTLESRNVLV